MLYGVDFKSVREKQCMKTFCPLGKEEWFVLFVICWFVNLLILCDYFPFRTLLTFLLVGTLILHSRIPSQAILQVCYSTLLVLLYVYVYGSMLSPFTWSCTTLFLLILHGCLQFVWSFQEKMDKMGKKESYLYL